MSLAWTVPTLAMLSTYIEASLVNKANSADLQSGQTDRFTQANVDVTAEIRNAIGRVPGFQNSATANSVPPELMRRTCWLIIGAMQSAYPGLALSKDQLKEVNDARKFIETIGTKENPWRPTMPNDPQTASDVQGTPMAAVVRQGTKRTITSHSMKGVTIGSGQGDHDWDSGEFLV